MSGVHLFALLRETNHFKLACSEVASTLSSERVSQELSLELKANHLDTSVDANHATTFPTVAHPLSPLCCSR